MVELDGVGAVYRQLYRALRADILRGRLRPGSRLPATRTLAAELGVSRNRVVLAFAQLLDEGYVVGRIGSGTYVASEIPDEPRDAPPRPRAVRSARTPLRLSRLAAKRAGAASGWAPTAPALRYDFRFGRPSFADFPRAVWRRLVARCARSAAARDLDYAPPAGLAALREAIAEHLARWRDIECSPEQIVVVHGSQQALGLIAGLLLDPGDRVVLEEPHYPGARLAFAGVGAELVPIAVDEQGLDTTALRARRVHPRLLYLTPSHQFPTGATMPLARRLALLDYAARHAAFVVEDDYDSEYRYAGQPLETLYGLDRHGGVIYVGTLSKILSPALRLGYVVAPPGLERALTAAKSAADFGTSVLEQRVLTEFLRAGHLDVHIRRSRRRHGARRAALVAGVERHLGDRALLLAAHSGLHVAAVLRDLRPSEVPELVARARQREVGIYPLRPFYLGAPRRAEILLGHGSLSEAEIDEGIARLADALRALLRARRSGAGLGT
jgi:GntR family transcriptional regulator/MocR family aminotransferase